MSIIRVVPIKLLIWLVLILPFYYYHQVYFIYVITTTFSPQVVQLLLFHISSQDACCNCPNYVRSMSLQKLYACSHFILSTSLYHNWCMDHLVSQVSDVSIYGALSCQLDASGPNLRGLGCGKILKFPKIPLNYQFTPCNQNQVSP